MQSEAGGNVEVLVRRPAFQNLSDRIVDFVVETIKSASVFPKSFAGSHIANQLVRSATSVGANYEEGCTAQSRPDFTHKMQIALKEMRETHYWIRLATRLELSDKPQWEMVAKEGDELLRILAKSVATAKGIKK